MVRARADICIHGVSANFLEELEKLGLGKRFLTKGENSGDFWESLTWEVGDITMRFFTDSEVKSD